MQCLPVHVSDYIFVPIMTFVKLIGRGVSNRRHSTSDFVPMWVSVLIDVWSSSVFIRCQVQHVFHVSISGPNVFKNEVFLGFWVSSSNEETCLRRRGDEETFISTPEGLSRSVL